MWKLIDESAPTDRFVMLWSERDGVGFGRWADRKYEHWENVDPTTKRLVRTTDHSGFCGTSAEGVDMWKPTHWSAIPPAPEGETP